jgi:hypothetical protein
MMKPESKRATPDAGASAAVQPKLASKMPVAGGFVLIISPLNGDTCSSAELVVDGEYGGVNATHVECKLLDALGTTTFHSQGPDAVSGDGTFQFVFNGVDLDAAIVLANVLNSGTVLDTDTKEITVF